MGGAFRRVDDRDRRILRPAEGPPRAERLEHCLRQRDLASQRRVHRVLEQLIVQQAVATDRMKVRLCVNQDAVVAGCDVAVDLLEARTVKRIG